MANRINTLTIAMACVASSTCSPTVPSSSMVGDWSGRVAPSHFATLEMRITQQGSSVTGVACYMDPGGSPPDGQDILFSNAPVVIDNPYVSVSAIMKGQSGSGTFQFNGQIQSDGTIAGQSSSGGDSGYPMALSRSGNYCGL